MREKAAGGRTHLEEASHQCLKAPTSYSAHKRRRGDDDFASSDIKTVKWDNMIGRNVIQVNVGSSSEGQVTGMGEVTIPG